MYVYKEMLYFTLARGNDLQILDANSLYLFYLILLSACLSTPWPRSTAQICLAPSSLSPWTRKQWKNAMQVVKLPFPQSFSFFLCTWIDLEFQDVGWCEDFREGGKWLCKVEAKSLELRGDAGGGREGQREGEMRGKRDDGTLGTVRCDCPRPFPQLSFHYIC